MTNRKYLLPIISVLYLAGCSTSPYGYFGNPTLEQVLNEHAEKVQSLPADTEIESDKREKQHLESMYQEWIILKPKIEKLLTLEAELKATNKSIRELNKASAERRQITKSNSAPSINSIPYKYTMQIGATGSFESAQKFWRQQQTKYPDILGSLSPKIELIKKQDKTFYRIKVGKYKAKKQAENDCEAYISIGGQCIVRKI